MPMKVAPVSSFERFAEIFIRRYWETVKGGAFSMPPNEPVHESIEELLSGVSHVTEVSPASGPRDDWYVLRMSNAHGDSWLFRFQQRGRAWELVAASAKSNTATPHDLLGPAYSGYFEPFLRHVETVTNDTKSI
jgi:hypothetical protein